MSDDKWRLFLQTARRVLGKGSWNPYLSNSWCVFTTFSSIETAMRYWACGFPDEDECLELGTLDGGLWRQSFKYSDLAHVVIPASFNWENVEDNKFENGQKTQNLVEFSRQLKTHKIDHRLTDFILEIKLY